LTVGGHSPVDGRGLGQDGARAVLDIGQTLDIPKSDQLVRGGLDISKSHQLVEGGGVDIPKFGQLAVGPGPVPFYALFYARPACRGSAGGMGDMGRRGRWESRFGHRIFDMGNSLDLVKFWTHSNPTSWWNEIGHPQIAPVDESDQWVHPGYRPGTPGPTRRLWPACRGRGERRRACLRDPKILDPRVVGHTQIFGHTQIPPVGAPRLPT
jgi:hypothetical protein